MRVIKFGGTSVGSANAIKQVGIIAAKHNDSIIVCSAMSGVTNTLLQMAGIAEKKGNFEPFLKELEVLHLTTIQSLLTPTQQNKAIIHTKVCLNELESMLESVSLLGELTDRTLAMILAFGERMLCTIVAEYLLSLKISALYTDARDLLVTTNGFNNATLLFKESAEKVKQWYTSVSGSIPVVTGFIASNKQGITTNLGRGGSDYTASILGSILDASCIEIWTDVDGFYTADPRLVKKAFPLKSISYNEALELSYFGAKVIYAPTLIPAINKQIPIWIKNTFNPDAYGTLIQQNDQDDAPLVKGVSSINDISLVNIIGNGMVGFKGFSARLFSALSQAAVNVILITQASSEHTITIAVSPSDGDLAMKALQEEFEYEIKLQVIEKPVMLPHQSIVAVVGNSMKHAVGVSGKLFSALGRIGVNVSAIAQGSSELNISVVIHKQDLAKSINAIHDAMFISDYRTLNLYIVGMGSIGKELLNQINQANARLKEHHHIYLQVAAISNSKHMIFEPEEGIPLNSWNEKLKHGEPASIHRFIERMATDNLPNSVFIDNTANADIAETYLKVFEHNVSVVTCNKIACSSSLASYLQLKKISRAKGLSFLYETNVGAGLPVIKTLQDLVISGDEVIQVEAVLSGTISYIFNNYIGNVTFSEIVKKAQDLGYTEPDPRDDLNGKDFMRKALILSREMGMLTEMDDITIQPLLPDICFKVNTVEDFYKTMQQHEQALEALKHQAAQEQKVLRYIANITKEKVSVELKLVDTKHPFYSLSGSDNMIAFTTERYKNNPLVVKGPGAGVAVTAAGVFADIVKTATY